MKKISSYWVVLFFGLLLVACGEDDEPIQTTQPPSIAPPTVSGFQPTSGPPGRTVTITGTNLTPPSGEPTVEFNNTPAKVISFSETEIISIVPAGIPQGVSSGKITVDVGTQSATSAGDFEVLFPELQITPLEGVAGEEITITVTDLDFETEIENNSVTFDGVEAEIVTVSSSELVVKIPASETGKIIVNTGEIEVISSDDFAFLSPTVENQGETKGPVGTEITITGTNFSPDMELNEVSFNGVGATLVSSTPTELKVIVPYGATSGLIRVTAGALSVETNEPFVVNSWRKLQDFPSSERVYPIAETIMDKIYVGLGKDLNNDKLLNDFWEFDPKEDMWIQLEDFPGEARYQAFSFVIEGELYVGGGNNDENDVVLDDVYKYNPNSGWSQVASIEGLDHQINEAVTYVLDKRAFVFGGGNPNEFATDVLWAYDPGTGDWSDSPISSSISAKRGAIAFDFNDVGYIGLGIGEGPTYLKDFKSIDREGNVSIGVLDYPGFGSYGCIGVVIGNKVYVGLGENEIDSQVDIWSYDLTNQEILEWKQKEDFPGDSPRGQFASEANGMLYMGLGSADNGNVFLKDIWEYNPANDSTNEDEEE